MPYRKIVPVILLFGSSILSVQQSALRTAPSRDQPLVATDPSAVAGLTGTVVDASGAVVPGATVLVRSAAGKVQKTTQSDKSGAFAFAGLPVGKYRILVSILGFQAKEMPVTLGTGELNLRVALAVGGVSTSIDVRGREDDLIGIANSATQGTVGAAELQARPILRSGEVLETVPGLIITQHAGGGKANQYFLRGFNLDHGTDFAIFIDGTPLNLPSHDHGEGYADMNTVIPELVDRLKFEKGPYYADVCNYGSAGSANLEFYKTLPQDFFQVEGGMYGFGRAVFGVSQKLGRGNLLYGGEVYHDDGPWTHPDNYYKFNGLVTYSQGGNADGFSVTARSYAGSWNSSDQIAENALPLVRLYGTLNPTDGGHSQRYSLQGEWHRQGANSLTKITGYGFFYDLNLFSDFTYYLVDPNRGDQFNQRDRRWVAGLDAHHTIFGEVFGRKMENTFGLQVRNDWIHNGLFQSENRLRVDKIDSSTGNTLPATTLADHFTDTQVGLYAENRIQWTDKVRSILGIRSDIQHFGVTSLVTTANSGSATQALPSPKASLVFGPWCKTEFYTQAGFSFHSKRRARHHANRRACFGRQPLLEHRFHPDSATYSNQGRRIRRPYDGRFTSQSTVSVWYLHSASELQQSGDTGGTVASQQPSERYGVEWANFYTPLEHVSFNFDLANSKALFTETDADDAAPGSPGAKRVPEAVGAVISSGVTLHDLQGFTSSLQFRYFGPRDLTSDALYRSHATALVNAEVGYRFRGKWKLSAEFLNVLNRKDHDIDYAYKSQITPAATPAFTNVFHPVEPFQVPIRTGQKLLSRVRFQVLAGIGEDQLS